MKFIITFFAFMATVVSATEVSISPDADCRSFSHPTINQCFDTDLPTNYSVLAAKITISGEAPEVIFFENAGCTGAFQRVDQNESCLRFKPSNYPKCVRIACSSSLLSQG